MDLILQKVRDSSLLFGGMLVIANGDTNQLANIDGSDIFCLPPYFLSRDSFLVGAFSLKEKSPTLTVSSFFLFFFQLTISL